MVYIFPNTLTILNATREEAFEKGCMEITEADYSDLCITKKMWQASGETYVIVDDPTYEARKQAWEEETARAEAEAAKINEVADLKQKLADSDYCVIKIAEGAATKEDYAEIIAQRQAWRERINELEN